MSDWTGCFSAALQLAVGSIDGCRAAITGQEGWRLGRSLTAVRLMLPENMLCSRKGTIGKDYYNVEEEVYDDGKEGYDEEEEG